MTLEFNISDAWLLLSIKWTQGALRTGSSLKDIISSGDAINHAIFNFDEVDNGLRKLYSIDYIQIKDNKILLTKKSIKDIQDKCKSKRSVLDQLDEYYKMLSSLDIKDTNIDKSSIDSYLTKTGFNSVIAEYISEATTIIDKILKK